MAKIEEAGNSLKASPLSVLCFYKEEAHRADSNGIAQQKQLSRALRLSYLPSRSLCLKMASGSSINEMQSRHSGSNGTRLRIQESSSIASDELRRGVVAHAGPLPVPKRHNGLAD